MEPRRTTSGGTIAANGRRNSRRTSDLLWTTSSCARFAVPRLDNSCPARLDFPRCGSKPATPRRRAVSSRCDRNSAIDTNRRESAGRRSGSAEGGGKGRRIGLQPDRSRGLRISRCRPARTRRTNSARQRRSSSQPDRGPRPLPSRMLQRARSAQISPAGPRPGGKPEASSASACITLPPAGITSYFSSGFF